MSDSAEKYGARSGRSPDPQEDGRNQISDTTVGYLVRDVHRALARSLQARIASHGVSMGQWFFLRALWDEDGLTQRELSQRVGMMEPTTVTALNGMERRGLVERVRNTHDRRKVNIFLTPKGRGLREVLLPCSVEVTREATHGVSDQELTTAIDVLRRMIANLQGNSGLGGDDAGSDEFGLA
jgi:DNA-binding MarR family transcriptional regulator